MKKIFTLVSLSTLLLTSSFLISCTSKEASTTETTPPTEDVASLDTELDSLSGTESKPADSAVKTDAAAATEKSAEKVDETNAGFLDEQNPNDQPPKDPLAAKPTDDQAMIQQPPSEQPPAELPPAETPPADVVAGVDPGLNVAPPLAEEKPAEPTGPIVEAPKPSAPLRKVESVPFRRAGILLNAVYLARPGDNYSKISSKIYSDEAHVKDLKKANASIKKVKPGDKIYYNSPERPQDDSKLAIFFDDKGVQPAIYVSKSGDDLKKISADLLSFPQAWKEVWATNSVESKSKLNEGTELRYWSQMPAPQHQNLAQAELPLPPPPEMTTPPNQMAQVQPELPPPPPPPAELPPPSPPEPVVAAPPPPPPPAVVAKKAPPSPEPSMMDNDLLMALIGGGVVVAGLAAILVIRRKKQQQQMAAAFGDTQVGS